MSAATMKQYDWNVISPSFSVADDINSNVFDIYFLIWSLS